MKIDNANIGDNETNMKGKKGGVNIALGPKMGVGIGNDIKSNVEIGKIQNIEKQIIQKTGSMPKEDQKKEERMGKSVNLMITKTDQIISSLENFVEFHCESYQKFKLLGAVKNTFVSVSKCRRIRRR